MPPDWVAAETDCDAPRSWAALGVREGDLGCVASSTRRMCAAQRANAALLDLHKRTAPRLTPVEQSLHLFLNSNVLPLAKSRNLIDADFTALGVLSAVLPPHAPALLYWGAYSPQMLSSASQATAWRCGGGEPGRAGRPCGGRGPGAAGWRCGSSLRADGQ